MLVQISEITQASELSLVSSRLNDIRVTAAISSAHFVAHFFYLVLPPLFPLVKAHFDVSYTALGSVMFELVHDVPRKPART